MEFSGLGFVKGIRFEREVLFRLQGSGLFGPPFVFCSFNGLSGFPTVLQGIYYARVRAIERELSVS